VLIFQKACKISETGVKCALIMIPPKKPKKLFLYLFILLSLAMTTAWWQTQRRAEGAERKLSRMTAQYRMVQRRLQQQAERLEQVAFLNFQQEALGRRYPVFQKILRSVWQESRRAGLSPLLVMSVIETESSCQPFAVSSHGAYGLMQINYRVWKDILGIDNRRLFDIDYNVKLGITILKRYLDRARGDLYRALNLYNNGFLYQNSGYAPKVLDSVYLQ